MKFEIELPDEDINHIYKEVYDRLPTEEDKKHLQEIFTEFDDMILEDIWDTLVGEKLDSEEDEEGN